MDRKNLIHRAADALRAFPWTELRFVWWSPLYLLGYAILERIDRPYWATQWPIDNYIPFRPEFVLAYDAWFALLIGTGVALLLAGKQAEYRRYMRLLAVTFLSSVALWVVLPNGQDLRPADPAGPFSSMVETLYRVDTCTNVFPSLHVVGAIAAAVAIRDAWGRTRRGLCAASDALAVLICLSTVFIKQHSVLDVLGGIAFCAVAWPFVYRTAVRDKAAARDIAETRDEAETRNAVREEQGARDAGPFRRLGAWMRPASVRVRASVVRVRPAVERMRAARMKRRRGNAEERL